MDKNVIGTNIQKYRKNYKMSQQNLADKLNVSNKTISKWECGNGSPDIDMLNKIADVFHISIEELINENKVNIEDDISDNVVNLTSNESITSINGTVSHQKVTNKKFIYLVTALSTVLVILFTCLVCYLFIPRDPKIIKTNLFSIDENNSTLYCIVDNEKSVIELSKEIEVSKNCKWGIYEDIAGTKIIESKTVNLNLGDNIFYIIIENSKDDKKVYKTNIRRKYVYSVVFDSNGGTKISDQTVSEGAYLEPRVPTRAGYIFKGWYYDAELYDFNNNSIKKDMNFIAEWEEITYTIRYETYDSLVDNSKNKNSFTINTETFDILDVSKVGYIFDGWYDGEDFDNSNKISKIEKGTATNIKLYAKWTIINYSITYNSQFGDIDNTFNKTSYTVNTETFDILDVSKKGYKFGGWYDSENFSSAKKVEKVEKSSTENLVLYAKWEIITYNIIYTTYDPTVDNSLNKESYTVETDTFILFDITKDGYIFSGWYNGEDFKNSIKIEQIEKGTAETILLYAKWDVITFNINYVTYYSDVVNSMNKTTFTINTETFDILDVSKKGYNFGGWYDSENFETANKIERIEKGTTKNLTLYAKWDIITYIITYETYDSSVDNSLNVKSYTIISDTFELKNLNRDGYKFEGWYDGEDSDKANKITEITKGSAKNYNLYAKWKVITYTISYEKYYDDVDNSVNRNSYNITTDTFEILSISKPGYEFKGWYDSENFETANKVERIEKGSTKNYTLYAKWDIITYTINYETYDLAVDNSLNIKSYTIVTDTFDLKDLNRDGYKFEGWYDGEDFDKSNKITKIIKGSTQNYNLYAKWKVITYTISYEKYYDDVDNSMNKNSYNITTETFELFSMSKKGYEFKGWYDSENFETANKVERIEKGSTKNYTLFANWVVISYTISYVTKDNITDGTLSEDVKITYTIEESFELEKPSCIGYMFVDWYDDKELENRGNVVKTISKGTIGDKTFYARWTDEFDHEGYRRIDSTDDFIKYRDTPVYYTDNARLYSRITLQYYLTEGVKWTPIGDSSNPFSAIFDGNGYDIIQFYLQSGEKYTSIFGTVKNATIKNLYVQVSGHILSNVAVKGAGLVYSLEDSIIENCAIEQDVLPSTIKNAPPNSFTYGGICYSMKGDSVISNSYYAGKIDVTVSTTLGATVGGLVVHMEGGKIINSYSNAYILITSTNNKKVSIGGLVGNMKDGEIINSFATGNIKSTSDISNLGGLVGIMTKGTITNCFATGDIYAPKSPETSLVGNLIGSNTEGVLDNCYGCVGQIIEGYTINNGSEKTFDELVEFTNEYYDSEIWVLRETELPYLKCFKVYYSAVEFNYTTSEGEQRKYYSVPIEEFNTRIGKYFDMFYSEVSMEELNSREKYQFIDFYYNNMPWSVERNVVNQGIYFEANYYYKFF